MVSSFSTWAALDKGEGRLVSIVVLHLDFGFELLGQKLGQFKVKGQLIGVYFSTTGHKQ
jgi:hypothetical protein